MFSSKVKLASMYKAHQLGEGKEYLYISSCIRKINANVVFQITSIYCMLNVCVCVVCQIESYRLMFELLYIVYMITNINFSNKIAVCRMNCSFVASIFS